MADNAEPIIGIDDLPLTFKVQYLGSHPANGLWGMKHTRKPVDIMVSRAKNLPHDKILPPITLQVNKEGIFLSESPKDAEGKRRATSKFSVDVISYGVQDLVYTRVFSMIIVTDESLKNEAPFMCHSFVCDSRHIARQITYALAAAFQDYGKRVKEDNKTTGKTTKRLAIDLRTPEEQAEASDGETEA